MHVYLHIGYPKTGSSAIQSHLAANRAWFLRKGVYIPSTGYSAGAGHVYIVPHAVSSDSSLELETSMASLKSELAEANNRGFQKAFLSWEGFAAARREEIAWLAEALQDCSVSVLAYVREQGEQYQSAVLQHVERLRMAQARTLFVRDNLLQKLPANYDYAASFALWQETFQGDCRVQTRIFEKSRLASQNVVIDLLNWLDLAPDEDFCLQSGGVNVSLDAQCGALLYISHMNGQRIGALISLSRALTSLVSKHGSTSKNFLSSGERESIWNHFQESNERLFREFRPQNAAPEELAFPIPETADQKVTARDDLRFFELVHAELQHPTLNTWQGNMIINRWTALIAGAPNTGWGQAEQNGVWSRGDSSELSFRLPQTHPVSGPEALNLVISGHYHGDNTMTEVRIGDEHFDTDLSQAVIRIAIDDEVRTQGVAITLRHKNPRMPGGATGDERAQGIAFKLQQISYDFLWADGALLPSSIE